MSKSQLKRLTNQVTACKKCGGEMKPGQAIEQTYTGMPDFPGAVL